MSATEKADVISKVEESPGSRRKIMAESGEVDPILCTVMRSN